MNKYINIKYKESNLLEEKIDLRSVVEEFIAILLNAKLITIKE